MKRDVAALIVEDDPLLRFDAFDTIERAGFKAYEAANADEAMALLENHTDIYLVVTDINMPGSMDGIRLVYRVRDRWPLIKLMVTSGAHKITERLLPEGSIFVGKPYFPELIVNELEAMAGA